MSNPMDEKMDDQEPASQSPPPYSEKLPHYERPDPLKSLAGPAPPMVYGVAPPVPTQYQVYYGPPGEGSNQIPILQSPQAIFITTVQPTNEPDYVAYSIFTMLCCFPVLGVAALIYSIQTQKANNAGNGTVARKYSRRALILSHAALGTGIVLLVLYIIFEIYVRH